jgi:UDP-N-acetylglucosamine 1-carboxyvinyltransferase
VQRLKVRGGVSLRGTVKISGAKNAALVLVAASLLASGKTVLENVPRISDIESMAAILGELGASVDWDNTGTMVIDVPERINWVASYDQAKKIRASNLVLGPIVGRCGRAEVALPGGCDIGPRPMDLHLKGLNQLGVDVAVEQGFIKARGNSLVGTKVYLDFPSVGATENIMMAACMAKGKTVVANAAKEPEIVDLANLLNAMGAQVRGAGTDIVKIDGVRELQPVRHSVIPDRIEAGTFMVAAAITGGRIVLENIIPTHLQPITSKLREAGVSIQEVDDTVTVEAGEEILPVDIKTLPYPGFPTDMQSQGMALLSLARGTSIIVENVFENRLQVAGELKRMGAKVKVEGRTAIIEGVPELQGAQVKVTDLRAGAALMVAGLAAKGETEILNAEHIHRGYEYIVAKLTALGAQIREK